MAMPTASEDAIMTEITNDRVCAEPETEIVVFLIGMRINKLWKVWSWLPVVFAMPRMLKELGARPELGMLAAFPYLGGRVLGVTQYWESVEKLQAYAHSQTLAHQPAWRRFNARVGTSGDVGIWHETYAIPAGNAESIYVNMPRYGLGAGAPLFPARGARGNAAKRLARRVGGSAPSAGA